jgi:hypothetical protein
LCHCTQPTSEISLTSRPLYFALLQTFRPPGNPSVQTGHNHVTNMPQGHHKQALKSIPRNLPACHFTTPDCCLLASVSVEMSRIQTHLLEEPFHPVITLTWTNKKRSCTHMPARHNMSGFRVRAKAHNYPLRCEHPHEQKITKTYNRRDSQMVTHSSTSRPVQCLCMAERTGCPVLTDLWSYVLTEPRWPL